MGLTIIGVILFLSVFLSGAFAMFSTDPFSYGPNFMGSFALRGFGGFILIVIGSVLRNVGAKGLAGSGVILDPQQARKDVEPWSRMAGGIAKDALDETGLDLASSSKRIDFEEKMRKLESLYKDGLLTEEEYQAKRQEFLAEDW
jgi:hypothetical protein